MYRAILAGILIIGCTMWGSGCGSTAQAGDNAKIPNMDVVVQTETEKTAVRIGENGTDGMSEGAQIQAEDAKRIALEDAGLFENDVIFHTVEQEYEHGSIYYEIEFMAEKDGENQKYEYEIDAGSGTIIAWDIESLYDD